MNFENEIKNLRKEVEEEYLNNIEPYWYLNTLDKLKGGFFGRIDFQNTAVIDSEKGGILNARILWSFSAAHKKFRTPYSAEIAHRAYHYLRDFFFDKKNAGIYWTVDPSGKISDNRKHVYVQAFAIYGLTEYYSAFGDEEALNYARELYRVIELHCKDEKHGGYFEAYSREWKLIDDVRLSDKDKNVPKSMNTHLHILEAYTNLYRYDPTNQLKKDLEDLVELFFDKIISSDSRTLHCFFSEKWEPKTQIISFGHDIEASWLLTEAVDVLNDQSLKAGMKSLIQAIADHVLSYGMDADGGLINEIIINGENDCNKDWWPQAEALVGFMNAYQMTGDSKYIDAVLRSWAFIQNHIIDKENGEWFEKVNRKGIPFTKLDKIRLWKAPYHNTRSLLEISSRCENLLESASEVSIPLSIEKPLFK